jgi:hypothetical protein
MSTPNDPDPWPRYAVLADALKLSRWAAQTYDVADKPTLDWTIEEILLVALLSLREEKHDP